jgi:hypothetical protein
LASPKPTGRMTLLQEGSMHIIPCRQSFIGYVLAHVAMLLLFGRFIFFTPAFTLPVDARLSAGCRLCSGTSSVLFHCLTVITRYILRCGVMNP